MKKKNTWVKLVAAAAAVAGIAYLVVRYYDTIHAWLSKLCPCCALEDDFIDDPFTPDPDEHTSAEEAPVSETVSVAEPTTNDTTPVADPADFAE